MPIRFNLNFYVQGIALLFVLLGIAVSAAAEEDEQYPLREKYFEASTIETDELFSRYQEAVIVDVRGPFEYGVLHMDKALNIPQNEPGFVERIRELRDRSYDRPIVFYCNGYTCHLSYEAAHKTRRAGIDNVLVYDSGILSWTKVHPEHAVLMGQAPAATHRLIGKEKLQQHLLAPKTFADRVDDKAVVLDIRDYWQIDITLFPEYQRSAPVSSEKLRTFVQASVDEGKPLLLYDQKGLRYQWVQYLLEDWGVQDYYFMAGGSNAFFDEVLN